MAAFIQNVNDLAPALNVVREVVVVFQYYNQGIVHKRLVRSANAFRSRLGVMQNVDNAINLGVRSVNLVGPWDDWIRDEIRTIAINTQSFVNDQVAAIRIAHQGRTTGAGNDIRLQVNEMLYRLARESVVIDANLMIAGLDGADWADNL
jgi:hypothetical protein